MDPRACDRLAAGFAGTSMAGPILTLSLTEGADGAPEVAIVGMGETGDVVYPFTRAE